MRGLGRRALRTLAARHGLRPSKSLGQHFLADPNLARRIVALAEVGPADRVVEVGAGLGSLTVALAEAGAEVLAVEFDRGVAGALREVVAAFPNVRVLEADALHVPWDRELEGGPWKMASNLPYNVAVPILFGLLEQAPQVVDYVVMVQREVGERLAAWPAKQAYGALSARLAYQAHVSVLRRVPPTVFWPEPQVESVLLRITPREPPVSTPKDRLFRVVDEGFAQRRKTMRNALVRLGLSAEEAAKALKGCGLDVRVRAESLGLPQFACLAEAVFDGE
ncbi:MAG: 16S rRNA (adenine(1518)-N(6)/adenine(1519)-N(6))-dimethyltransferase RsmA [Actinomycetota bacterium]|nr:16S rRNA (adenine(1518)-N(6)/adenine(1519)-N(6))-dimethyltransferase RsmA [Actinomycetota bacterium]